jgi:colicin import membrane protein
MARKLKVYRTSAGGFFELAVAAPSMKAAAEAWGADKDIFERGYAEQTDDPKVVEAAMAAPGIVLRRPVGSQDEFSEHAPLPKAPKEKPKQSAHPPELAAPAKKSSRKIDERAKRAAALERQRERQALQRQKKEATERERARKERKRIEARINIAFEKARTRHNEAVKALALRREELDKDEAREMQRWETEQRRRADALKELGS